MTRHRGSFETEQENTQVMSRTDQLCRAVKLVMKAGYQLDQEAFGFLTMLAAAEDPTEVISMALKRLEDSNDKPAFIGRPLLENLLQKNESREGNGIAGTEELPGKLRNPPQSQITEAKRLFHPFSKEIEARIKVIEDPSSEANSTGTIEDFLGYFRNRFERIEKLLRKRMDVKSATSIKDSLKATPNSNLKIIGMVTDKRESKQRTIFTVEDLQTSVTALVPQNATDDLKRKARMLLLDQVVCLSVRKTRGTLLIVEGIILPEIGQKAKHRAETPVCAALTSDLHVGSGKFRKEAFNRFVLWLNGKHGNEMARKLAGHVKYVLIAGDIVDGIGIYPKQLRELAIKDIRKQYNLAARCIEQIPDYIEVVVIPGNHDAPRKTLPQPAISGAFLETLQEARNVHSLGNPSYLGLHDVEILTYHGRSLDDVISTVPGMSNNSPDEAMRLLLQCRHLAPSYGGKTLLSPENRDHLVIEHVPDIFHAGHIHALRLANYRGVLLVNSGGWQEQTAYMQRLGFTPTPGEVPVVNLQTLETTIVPFDQTA